jgi:hypothetical protein
VAGGVLSPLFVGKVAMSCKASLTADVVSTERR